MDKEFFIEQKGSGIIQTLFCCWKAFAYFDELVKNDRKHASELFSAKGEQMIWFFLWGLFLAYASYAMDNVPLRESLYHACVRGDNETVENLAQVGLIDLMEVYTNGETPLIVALKNRHKDVAMTILKHVEKKTLWHWLFVSSREPLNSIDKTGRTALMWACQQGFLDVVRNLVDEKDAFFNYDHDEKEKCRCRGGDLLINENPFTLAITFGQEHVVSWMLENTPGWSNLEEELRRAIDLNKKDMVVYLLNKGAKIDSWWRNILNNSIIKKKKWELLSYLTQERAFDYTKHFLKLAKQNNKDACIAILDGIYPKQKLALDEKASLYSFLCCLKRKTGAKQLNTVFKGFFCGANESFPQKNYGIKMLKSAYLYNMINKMNNPQLKDQLLRHYGFKND